MTSLDAKKNNREYFAFLLFMVIVITALGIKIMGFGRPVNDQPGPTRAPSPADEIPAPAAATTTDVADPTTPMNQVTKIIFTPAAALDASGDVSVLAQRDSVRYALRARLPATTQAYEYGAWIQSAQDNIFHRLGRLVKNPAGEYALETTVPRDENHYTKIMITLEFIHTTSTPGQTVLEAQLTI